MNRQLLTRLLVASVITATVVMGIGPAAMAADVDSSGPYDVVFVIDGSPSMEGNASATSSMSVEFARAIAEKRPDSRFAVMVYTDHRWTSLQRAFTSDLDELRAGVSSITYGRNSTENATGAILRSLDSELPPVMSFRESATPLVVVVTDEDDDGYCSVGQEAIESIDRQGAVLVSVAPDTPFDPGQPEPSCLTDPTENDLDTIATEQVSNGYWVELQNPDFSPVLEDIPESTPTPTPTPTPTATENQSVSWVSNAEPDPARFEIINRSVEPTNVTLGQQAVVRVVVTNEGDKTEHYEAVLSNGSEVLRRDRVLMYAGKVHSFEWNVTPADIGNTTFYVNDAEVGTIEVSPASEGNATNGTPTETAIATATRAQSMTAIRAQSTTTATPIGSASKSPSTAVETPLAVTPRTEETAAQPANAAGLGIPAIIGLSAVGVSTLVLLRRAGRDL